MNKYIKSIAVLALSPIAAAQAQSIDSLFAKAPYTELQMLERNPRLDMLDLYNYKMTAKGENIFGGYSVMESKTNDHIFVKLTDASTWEMSLLPTVGGDSIISCIHTVKSPAADSEITFYRADWTPLKEVDATVPQLEEFLVERDSIPADSVDSAALNSLMEKIAVPHIQMRWIMETGHPARLEYSISTANLSEEDNRMARFCLKTIARTWPFAESDKPTAESGSR